MRKMTDHEALNRVAVNLKRLRAERGWTYREAAKQCETYPGTVKRIEDAANMPGVGLLTRIAEAFEVTVDDLLQQPPRRRSQKAS